jgi:hypothetical protein
VKAVGIVFDVSSAAFIFGAIRLRCSSSRSSAARMMRFWRYACVKCSRRSSLFRQFADVDRARCCQDCNFIVICLRDIGDVARPVRDNVDTSLTSEAVID